MDASQSEKYNRTNQEPLLAVAAGVLKGFTSSLLSSPPQRVLPWERVGGKSLVDGVEDRNRTVVMDWKAYLKGMLDWPRPSWTGHWPPFGDYVGKEYDPNRWEEFKL
jgi:hypothetical protein